MSTGTDDHRRRTDRQRQVWDKAAPAYDRQMAFFERVWFTGGREWLAERTHGRVLEVAVGTGRNFEFYAPGTDLTGVDLSPEMLARAGQHARQLGLDVELHQGDASELPFADAQFDTVVCALALCSIPDPAGAIVEMRRVLVSGGQLLLLDHIRSTWPPIRAGQWLVEQVSGRTAGEYFTRRQRPLVEAAGFEIVEAERLKAGTVERIRAVKPSPDPADRRRARDA